MSKPIIMNQSLIEYLLSVPDIFKKSNAELHDLLESYQRTDAAPPLDISQIQTAYFIRKFIDEIPGGFFIYHADDKEELIYANQALLRIFNCNSLKEFKELTGNSFKGIVHPDDLEKVEQSIKEQISQNQYNLDYVEYRIIQKGGEIRWIDDYGHFIHSDTAGDVFYVFVGDATEKKHRQQKEKEEILVNKIKTEQTLIKQIEEYDQELENMNQEHLRRLEVIEALSLNYESIFYVDLDKNRIQPYRISNRIEYQFKEDIQTCEFIGFSSEYINQWVHPLDREIFLKANTPEYIRKRLSGTETFHINYRIIKDGKTKYLQLHVVDVGNSEHISQIVMGYRSVDDEIIHEMEQKKTLETALEQATLANNAKNTFLSNMSHDIRTPMNAIVGFTTLAKNHIDSQKKVLGYLDMIEASSEQLLHLLNDVLEISRIESGKIQVEETESNLLDIIQDVHQRSLSRASLKNIALSLDVSELKHYNVYCDRQKLSQILFRLTSNAIKYTNPDGIITIMVTELHEDSNGHASYQFIVEDNGIGIGKDFFAHMFEPFEREKNTTLSGIHGTGLGLTITKNLVEMLDGTIHVDSVVGKGSKFMVTFRFRLQNEQTSQPCQAKNISKHAASQKRILIVEDNEINLEIEVELLKDAGFLVDTAKDGSIAIEKIKQIKPGYYDLILMDIQMPIMDGYRTARAIRNLDDPALSSIPIIALSANTFDEDKQISLENGMNAHMEKPINTPQLLNMIDKLTCEY